mgnify:CR=1 FL=1
MNKRTSKDAYPLPLIDACQGLQSSASWTSSVRYWQVPVDLKDQEKAAFSPGPGMGLFQFTRMSFSLCGAPSTFQRLMDVVMQGLPFATTYIDDVLIHLANEELHKSHLRQAFPTLERGRTNPQRKRVPDWNVTGDIPGTYLLQNRNVTRQQQDGHDSKLAPTKG